MATDGRRAKEAAVFQGEDVTIGSWRVQAAIAHRDEIGQLVDWTVVIQEVTTGRTSVGSVAGFGAYKLDTIHEQFDGNDSAENLRQAIAKALDVTEELR